MECAHILLSMGKSCILFEMELPVKYSLLLTFWGWWVFVLCCPIIFCNLCDTQNISAVQLHALTDIWASEKCVWIWWLYETITFTYDDAQVVHVCVVAEQAEEGKKEGCSSASCCEEGWTEKGCQPIIWEEAKKLRHWYVGFMLSMMRALVYIFTAHRTVASAAVRRKHATALLCVVTVVVAYAG